MKTYFHNKNYAQSLTFIIRFKATRKRPIMLVWDGENPIQIQTDWCLLHSTPHLPDNPLPSSTCLKRPGHIPHLYQWVSPLEKPCFRKIMLGPVV